ncbi:ADP-ribosylglycohydrolase family protein, partial [Candidatus Micrarchaeota archaeon]|nr:ADP-ribosylglycohydrolase family protein [Candidatus Micrarchaeota archaeon]
MNKTLHDRYLGTLFGLAYGDAFGAPFEFWNADKIQEHFADSDLVLQPFMRGNQEFPAGFTTDDTSQMICLAESLLENGFDLEDQFDRYYRWLNEGYGSAGGSAYGIGQHTVKVLLAGKE